MIKLPTSIPVGVLLNGRWHIVGEVDVTTLPTDGAIAQDDDVENGDDA